MGNRLKLIGVVVEAGMPRNGAETTLDSDSGMDALAIANEMSQRFPGAGVPCFVIDQKITLIGTQPTSVLVEAGDPKLLSINLLMNRRYSKQMLRFVFSLVLQKQAPGSSGVASPTQTDRSFRPATLLAVIGGIDRCLFNDPVVPMRLCVSTAAPKRPIQLAWENLHRCDSADPLEFVDQCD